MDNALQNHIRQSLAQQIQSVLNTYDDLADTALGFDLRMALTQLNNVAQGPMLTADAEDFDPDEDLDEPPVPRNFAHEEAYREFLETQSHLLPQANGDEITTLRPDDVVGTMLVNGEWVETGDMDTSLERVGNLMAEANTITDEDTGEILFENEVPEVEEIRVVLTRDEGVLTEAHVQTILQAPQTQAMRNVFGTRYHCVAGATEDEQILTFTLPQNDRSRRAGQALMHGREWLQFAGHLVFPGIGGVTAQVR